MAASFAGSRSLDERRRRRLAGGTEEQETSAETEVAFGTEDKSPHHDDRQPGPPGCAKAYFPVRRLISPRPWKHWLLAVVGLSAGAGILAGAAHAEALVPVLGPGFAHLFALPAGRAARCWHVLLLILSAQLALFLGWARGCSLRDFSGSYRRWAWIAAALAAAAVAVATRLHLAFSETVCWLWPAGPGRFEPGPTLCWLIPAAAAAALVAWMIHRETAPCRPSSVMLWTAIVSLLAAGLLTLETPPGANSNLEARLSARLPFDLPPSTFVLSRAGFGMLGTLALFVSLLEYARYVVHVSADPPPRKRVRFRLRLPRIRLPKLRIRKRAAATGEPEEKPTAEESPPAENQPQQEAKKKSRKKKSKSKPKQPAPAAPPDRAVEKEPAAEKEPAGRRDAPAPAPTAAPADDIRVDQPLDPEMLKGLSKRQRRKLRRQHRQAQRAAGK